MIRSIWLAAVLTIVFTAVGLSQVTAIPFSKTISRLEAGIVIGQNAQPRWNRTVMLAKPRIASGDTSALPQSIRNAVSKFVLAIVATVDLDPQSLDPKYRLAEVGVGYCAEVNSQLQVVHSDNKNPDGVSLSFLDRQLLAENERQLENARTIARGSSLLMFDVPAILLQQSNHREYRIRHLVWIDSKSGRLATMAWLTEADRNGRLCVVTDEPVRWLDADSIEDRAIHVDGKEFTLGIPSKRAFALERFPAGRPIPWSQRAADLAALEDYDLNSIQHLMRALNDANLTSLQPQK